MTFPRLPAVDAVDEWLRSNDTAENNLDNTYLVAVQHRLRTTGSLIDALLQRGWKAGNIFLAGKPYSDSAEVVARLEQTGIHLHRWTSDWRPGHFGDAFQAEIERFCDALPDAIYSSSSIVVLLDDGGRLIKEMSRRSEFDSQIAAVEQTTSGIEMIRDTKGHAVPTVMVAMSEAKILHESPMIAEKTLSVLKDCNALPGPDGRVGVVGVGAIGSSMAAALAAAGHGLSLYDIKGTSFVEEQLRALSRIRPSLALRDRRKINIEDDFDNVLESCRLVLGASGQDLSTRMEVSAREHPITLGSCSSEDVEWRTLLRAGSDSLLSPESFRNVLEIAGSFRVLNSGFPVNFTGEQDSVPPENIQLTRGLLYAAIHAAHRLAQDDENDTGTVFLSPELEAAVVDSWKQGRSS